DNYEYDQTRPNFRFVGDMGGEVSYSDDFDISSATLERKSGVPGVKQFLPSVSSNIDTVQKNGNFTGNSSHIKYVLNSEITGQVTSVSDAVPGFALDKNWKTLKYTNAKRNDADLSEGIAQIKVWNPDGIQYVYGLPTYNRNESSISYGLVDGATIYNRNLAYQIVDETVLDNKIAVGKEMEAMYATNYLLTQITTSDYVDVTDNGPTTDDFGGYTR